MTMASCGCSGQPSLWLPGLRRSQTPGIDQGAHDGECQKQDPVNGELRGTDESIPLAMNRAAESATSAHASHAATRTFMPSSDARFCSFAPSVTTPLYGRLSPKRYGWRYEGRES